MAPRTCALDAMPAAARHRLQVTVAPRLAAILDRHSPSGEPRAATEIRLAEGAGKPAAAGEDFLVFHPERPLITTEEVADVLDREETARWVTTATPRTSG